ncbi:MAG: helix-turn-helix domain-containing protein [Ruminococcus flavefaciens]|nr:helix-turn-helix domain-containing protein [Ruminococcus flavefaciens]
MFWDNFYYACLQKGTKPNPLAKELQIASGSMTSWKNGKLPNGETLLKIANYLDVSVDYLLGRTDLVDETSSKIEDISDNNQQDFDKETIEIAEMIKDLSLIERSKVILFIEEIRHETPQRNIQISKIPQQFEKIARNGKRTILSDEEVKKLHELDNDEPPNLN